MDDEDRGQWLALPMFVLLVVGLSIGGAILWWILQQV